MIRLQTGQVIKISDGTLNRYLSVVRLARFQFDWHREPGASQIGDGIGSDADRRGKRYQTCLS